jgi:CRISPR-associated protein Csx10
VRLSLEPWVSRFAEGTEGRVRNLNRRAGGIPEFAGKVVFSCLFVSRAILYDEWLCARPTLAEADLPAALVGYEALSGFSRTEPVTGWHAAAKLPKFETEAISAGSCFLFFKDVAEPERKAEYARLAGVFDNLERQGIGERLDEGFGEVVFCHPFHAENAEVL